MPIHTAKLNLNSKGNADIHDITDQVAGALSSSGIENGILTVFTPSATSA
jgi:thiamine phosphate synthase YjbQ (UPF0047 family)